MRKLNEKIENKIKTNDIEAGNKLNTELEGLKLTIEVAMIPMEANLTSTPKVKSRSTKLTKLIFCFRFLCRKRKKTKQICSY